MKLFLPKYIKEFLSRYILYILAFIFVVFSLFPSIYEIQTAKRIRSDRYFELVHNFYTDYNFYLSRIRQGIEGRTTVLEKYTSEPHNGSLVQIFYLALGWAGRWTRTPWHMSGGVYHVARIVFGMTLLFLIAFYAKQTFKPLSFQILGFLFAVTASAWATFILHAGEWRYAQSMSWWTVMDTLQRITHIPHLLAGQALIVFLAFTLGNVHVISRSGNAIFLGILGFLLGMIFPPGLLFIIAFCAVTLGIDVLLNFSRIKSDRHQWIDHHVLPFFIFIVLSAPALLYLQLMVSFYPWKQLVLQDILRPLPFHYTEYFLSVGPILPLGLLGFILALANKQKRFLVLISWVVTWLFLLFLFRFIPSQSPLRFSQMLVHVPLGFLAAYFVMELFLAGKRYGAKDSKRGIGLIMIFLSFTIPFFSIIYGLGNMYSSWRWQKEGIDTKLAAAYPLMPTGAYIMYPLKDMIDAIRFIQDSTSRDIVVLSSMTFGNYVPVYSGNTVFLGHPNNTVDVERKQQEVKQFYGGSMGKDEAYAWMKNNSIGIVVYGPQEREYGPAMKLLDAYPFLIKKYENTYFELYTMNK